MSIKAVILFLLLICALGIIAGPGFRRIVARLLGLPVRPLPPRLPRHLDVRANRPPTKPPGRRRDG
ncbi:hypothetical protein DRW48_02920 [Paracoccus suum]|uniref:Cellulose biosynthesis protein BcsF n=1 Tax=Paracoccus suum TaxID=2259340 RepID=A0A344PHC6_9RHOB|nr:hypothetical protein [Paracoccus suum]AXC48781.1 hypothetical protein DRW48_02920 [Paracoccus suum]